MQLIETAALAGVTTSFRFRQPNRTASKFTKIGRLVVCTAAPYTLSANRGRRGLGARVRICQSAAKSLRTVACIQPNKWIRIDPVHEQDNFGLPDTQRQHRQHRQPAGERRALVRHRRARAYSHQHIRTTLTAQAQDGNTPGLINDAAIHRIRQFRLQRDDGRGTRSSQARFPGLAPGEKDIDYFTCVWNPHCRERCWQPQCCKHLVYSWSHRGGVGNNVATLQCPSVPSAR